MNLELALFLFNTRNSKKVCEDQMMLLPLPLQPLLPRTPMFFITPHMRRFRNLNFFVKKEPLCLRTLPQMPNLLERLGFRHNFIFASSACLFILCDFLVWHAEMPNDLHMTYTWRNRTKKKTNKFLLYSSNEKPTRYLLY